MFILLKLPSMHSHIEVSIKPEYYKFLCQSNYSNFILNVYVNEASYFQRVKNFSVYKPLNLQSTGIR
jgi:hypothetical protein